MRLAHFLLAGAAFPACLTAQPVYVQDNVSGKEISTNSSGDLVLDGHCFGNVPTLPSGGVASFAGNAIFKDGNFYGKGAITYGATSFSGMSLISSSSNILASVSTAGALTLRGTCVNTAGCSNTRYEPTVWNDAGTVQYNNNCYNYGNDKITGTYAQPGNASGNPAASMSVTDVRDAALSDGLTWVGWTYPGNTYSCGSGHLVFMAIDPGVDYHWWRLDQETGAWSHKPAWTPAVNEDASYNPISNPLASDRDFTSWFAPNYTDNGGFYCTCGGLADIN
jgi:hypothetical protein